MHEYIIATHIMCCNVKVYSQCFHKPPRTKAAWTMCSICVIAVNSKQLLAAAATPVIPYIPEVSKVPPEYSVQVAIWEGAEF